MATIPITEITVGEVNGTGYFDQLMKSVNAHLDSQFKLGRIKGNDYANVYLGAMQYAMQQAVVFALGRQQADKQEELIAAQISKLAADEALVEQKRLTEIEQTALVIKHQNLYQKQTDGFDRDAEQKALKLYTDLWTIGRSTNSAQALPLTVVDDLNDLLLQVITKANLTEPV